MHRSLSIYEIIYRICDYLYEDIQFDREDSVVKAVGDLNAFSRTSKAFSGQALDALWRTQWSLGPLVSCLPCAIVTQQLRCVSGEWKQCRVVSLKSAPVTSDWEAIASYVERVKHLTGPSPLNAVYIIDPGALGALLFACSTPMLPNLSTASHLAFPIEPPHRLYHLWLDCMWTKKLGELTIEYPFETSAREVDNAGRQLARKSPELRKLSITCPSKRTSDSPLLPGLLGPVSTLRKLESLYLSIDGHEIFFPPLRAASIYPFSCLHDLELDCGTVNQVVEAIWAIEANNLRRLNIYAIGHARGSYQERLTFTRELSQQSRWTSTLESLIIELPVDYPTRFELDPLFAFTNLKCLQLYNVDSDLTDSAAKRMVQTWPLMEKTILHFSRGLFSLTYFGTFVTRWPQLRHLETNAKIDSSATQSSPHAEVPATPSFTSETLSNQLTPKPGSLNFIITSGYAVESPDAVARWIHDVSHPKTVHLKFDTDEEPDNRESWTCVQHALENLYKEEGMTMS